MRNIPHVQRVAFLYLFSNRMRKALAVHCPAMLIPPVMRPDSWSGTQTPAPVLSVYPKPDDKNMRKMVANCE